MYNGNLTGRMLGNRYEVLEKIGTGGMATVYKAKCHLLNRFVAIKVLREELKGDEEIVKKFHVESQAAASLSHHNIVSIYDVGEEDGNNYIVMEYVDGITLKEYIKEKGVLDWREACRFAESICSALDHAHKKHIIHRDIKPHNILLTKDKIIKVTDFGIARAVSSETLVAGSSALGSVHYISPEQARGGYTDERSDIYSMGIVLYEMLTGIVPFNGDNPVMVALKHIEEEPKDIRLINPNIPDRVADIAMKAIKKEQHARYQTAAEMGEDLKRALDDYQNPSSAKIIADVTANNPPARKTEEVANVNANGKKGKKVKKPKTEQEKKEDKLAVIFALITIGIILVIAFGTYFFIRGGSREVVVPDLLNMTLEEAQKAIEGKDIKIAEEYETQPSDDVEEGHIIFQDPGANKSVKKNTEIKLVISSGNGDGDIEVPSVLEMSYDSAAKLLKEKGLKVEKKTEDSDSVSEGSVIRQDPVKGSKVNAGDTVVLYVSTGSEDKISVPSLTGSSQSKAESSLKSAGLQVGNISKESSDQPAGTVIRQSPASGSKVSKGSFVNIVLSDGTETAPTETPKVTETPKDNHTSHTQATPVPTAQPITKQKTLTITFPSWVNDTVNVRVVANGTVIHNQDHSKSEGGTRITVKGSKDATVEIYLDGKLTDTKTITFD